MYGSTTRATASKSAAARRSFGRRTRIPSASLSSCSTIAPHPFPPPRRAAGSVRLEPRGPKRLARRLVQLVRRGLRAFERVVEAQFLPFVAPHLVEGQHFDALDIPQPCCELGDRADNYLVVGQPGDEGEADPDRPLPGG